MQLLRMQCCCIEPLSVCQRQINAHKNTAVKVSSNHQNYEASEQKNGQTAKSQYVNTLSAYCCDALNGCSGGICSWWNTKSILDRLTQADIHVLMSTKLMSRTTTRNIILQSPIGRLAKVELLKTLYTLFLNALTGYLMLDSLISLLARQLGWQISILQ